MKFKPDTWYVIIGSKALDDGTIPYIGECPGEDVQSMLAEHFRDHPSGDPVQVTERLGMYKPVVTIARVE